MKHFKLIATSVAMLTASAPMAAEIEFWYGNAGRVETAIQVGCEGFNAAQSEHTITCVGQGGYEAGMQRAIAAYRSNQHPVLIQFFDAGTLDLMLSDAVVPVADVMPNVDWDDYLNGARSYYEASTGDLFSQPYNGSTLVFYANMAQLAEVGVSEVPETWEDVIDVAQKLKANGHSCPFTTDAHPWRVLEQFSARHGEAIASNHNGYGGLDAEYIFNDGFVAQHLNNLFDWREQGLVRLDQDVVAGKYTAAFISGECAMMESSTGSYGAAFAALGEDVAMGMAPMYEGVDRHNTLIGGASIWVMKGHTEEELNAARAYLSYLRQNEVQAEFTKATGYMPVTKTAFDAIVASGQSEELAFATVELGVSSLNQPSNEDSRGIRLGFYVQFRDIFKEEVQKAFNGDQEMQVALDNAKRRGDELLRRFEQTYQGVTLP